MLRAQTLEAATIVAALAFSFAMLETVRAETTTSPLPDQPAISTLAGSGALGFTDGVGAAASFVTPAGLAYAQDGTLYVADRGSQRIRRVDPDGRVSTVAGSGDLVPLGIGVPGGFANGTAGAAQFDAPESLAVESDGTILVADTQNSCIRSIAHGFVTTFAGQCRKPGGRDGPMGDASFSHPRSIAVEANGDIFVVDPPNGIRKISNHVVSTFVTAHGVDAISISVPPGPESTLLVASAAILDIVDPNNGKVSAEIQLDTSFVAGATREGIVPDGPPTGIAGYAFDDFVFADPYDSAVFLCQLSRAGSYLRVLGAAPSLEAPIVGAGYKDGAGATAQFDEPYAVAVAPDGTTAVADLGNRRIRIISRFNHDSHVLRVDRGTEVPNVPDHSIMRIAVVGDSYVGALQGWDDSIAGEFERAVNAARPESKKRIVVYPISRAGTSVFELLSLVDEALSGGSFDAVVLDVPDRGQLPADDDTTNRKFPAGWPAKARAAIANEGKRLAGNGSQLVVLLHPGALDFQDEMTYRYAYKGPAASNPLVAPIEDASQVQGFRNDVLKAVRESGVPVIDCWPAMVADHGLSTREPLFGSWDHHFTPHGRSIIAAALTSFFAAAP